MSKPYLLIDFENVQPKTLDRLQYGAGFAIAFGLFGTLLGIALARFLGAA